MKGPLHTLITIFFSILFLFVQAQNKMRLDSLFNDLKTATDTSRQKIICDIVWEYRNTDPEKAKKYAEQAVHLAKEINFSAGLIKAYNAYGLVYYNISEYDKALSYFDSSLQLAIEKNSKRGMMGAYNNMGNVYGDKGDQKRSLEYYLKGEKLIEALGDDDALASSYANIGAVYSVQDNFKQAVVYFEKARDIMIKGNLRNPRLITIYNNIGSVFANSKDPVNATLNFKLALDLARSFGNTKGIATCYENIGSLKETIGDHDSAEYFTLKALKIYQDVGLRENLTEIENTLGNIYYQKKDYKRSLEHLSKAEELMNEIGATYLSADIYLQFAKTYSKTGDFNKAYDYQVRFMNLKDSIHTINNEKQLNELQAKYENDKKEKEIEVLNATDAKNKTIIYAAIGGLVLIMILAILLFNRNRVKQKANKLLEIQNGEIQEQKQIIEEKNKDITDSIRYAQRIQNAILPSDQMIKALFPDSFVLFKPKDIVSGDFYWFEKWGNEILVAAADCTGHGVPGALMSVVGYNLLNQAVNEHGLTKPNLMLNELNKGISKMMRQNVEDNVQDGMDIALCSYSPDKMFLQYSGAFNALYLVRKGKLEEFNADKIAIGSYRKEEFKSYTNQEIQLQRGDAVYVFTDGFADQFGGPRGKKFKYKPFQDLLLKINDHNMDDQKNILIKELETWKGKLEQVDDILIIGLRV